MMTLVDHIGIIRHILAKAGIWDIPSDRWVARRDHLIIVGTESTLSVSYNGRLVFHSTGDYIELYEPGVWENVLTDWHATLQ